MKEEVRNLAASVHGRLLNKARAEGRPFQELLQYYVNEGLLRRIFASRHSSRLVLKGALMLQFWGGGLARVTSDVDLLSIDTVDPDGMLEVIRECLLVPIEPDGLVFDSGSLGSTEIRLTSNYGGTRVRGTARLGKARAVVQVDVAVGDAVWPHPVPVMYPPMLGNSGFKILGYTRESAVAEKFHALVSLGLANSRMKDFHDLWTLASAHAFDGGVLSAAIREAFRRRRTQIPKEQPVALTAEFFRSPLKQAQWAAFQDRYRLSSAGLELSSVTKVLGSFLLPPMNWAAEMGPIGQIWLPGGPWARQGIAAT